MEAYKRLEEIHSILETKKDTDLDTLLVLQKEAKDLHTFLLGCLSTLSPSPDDISPPHR